MGQSDTNLYNHILFRCSCISIFHQFNSYCSRCGNTNYYLAFMVTIVPWVFIFGLLNIINI